ncbi:YflT domain-containing protein [Angustibacter aerolatus]
MAGPAPRGVRPSLDLDFPQSLGVFDRYDDAQRAVDYLSDEHFPVENCVIVGTELKQVERVTGRLTYARAAMAGAASGAWMGVFVGLLLNLLDSRANFLSSLLTGVLLGIAFGIAFGVAGFAATGGRRDFTSVTQTVATRYEVLVEHRHLLAAQELLQRMPGRPQQPL